MIKTLDHQKKFFNKIAITYHKYSRNNLGSLIRFHKITRNYISGNLLDIGSGGIIGYEIEKAKSVTLADIASETLKDPKYIKNGKLTPYTNKKLKSVVANVMKMPFRETTFDTVVMVTTAHHLSVANKYQTKKNIKKSFQEINRVLKKKGIFIIHECFLNPVLKLFQEIFFSSVFSTLKILNKPLPYFMSENQLALYLKNAGFSIIEVKEVKSGKNVFIPLLPMVSPPGWLWDIIQPSKTYICQKN